MGKVSRVGGILKMENLDNTPTREMNQKQWDQFRKRWINEWASGLIVECGMDEVSAKEVADHNLTHLPYRNWCPHCVTGK